MPEQKDTLPNQADQDSIHTTEKQKWHERIATKVKENPFVQAVARRVRGQGGRKGLETLSQLTELDPLSKRLQEDAVVAAKILHLSHSSEQIPDPEIIKQTNPNLYDHPTYLIWASQEEHMPPNIFQQVLNRQFGPDEQASHYTTAFAKAYPEIYAECAKSGIYYKVTPEGERVAAPENDPELYRIGKEAMNKGFESEGLSSEGVDKGKEIEKEMVKEWVRSMTLEKAKAYARMDKQLNTTYNQLVDDSVSRKLLTGEESKTGITTKITLHANEAETQRRVLETAIPPEVTRDKPFLAAYAKTILPDIRNDGMPDFTTREGVIEAMQLLQKAFVTRDEQLQDYPMNGYLQREDNRTMQKEEAKNPTLRLANAFIYEVSRRALDAIRKRDENEACTLLCAYIQREKGIQPNIWLSLLQNETYTQNYINDIENKKISIDLSEGSTNLIDKTNRITNKKVRDIVQTKITGLFEGPVDSLNTILVTVGQKLSNGFAKYSESVPSDRSSAQTEQTNQTIPSLAEQQVLEILNGLEF